MNLKPGGRQSSVRFSLLNYTIDEDESLKEEHSRLLPEVDDNDDSDNNDDNALELLSQRFNIEMKYDPSFHPPPSFSAMPSFASTDFDEDEPSVLKEELEFSDGLDLDFGLEPKSWVRMMWQGILGLTASLDILATLLSYNYGDLLETEEKANRSPPTCTNWGTCTNGIHNWVLSNTDNISMMFSFLWFVDALILAHRQNKRARIQIERQRLLLSNEEIRSKVFRTRVVHFLSAVAQLLLLPTSLYLYVFRYTNDDKTRELLQDGLLVGLIKTTTRYYYVTMNEYVTDELRSFARRIVWHRLWRNPFKLRRDIKRILTLIRWIRYLAPLGGNMGNLLRHLTEMRALYRQERLALVARRQRAALRGALSKEKLLDYYATQIQAAWRMRKARKFRVALAIIRGDKERLHYYTQQKKLRMTFKDGLSIAAQKHEKLRTLEAKAEELHRMKKRLNQPELRDLYQLRQDLQTETSKLLNKRLLLRPDAWFILIWKNVFVVAVLMELAGLALIPLIEKGKSRDAEPLTMTILLQQIFLPVPIRQRCYCVNERKQSWLRRVWKGVAGFVVLPLAKRTAGVANANVCTNIPLDSWYCSPTYETLQSVYISFIKFFVVDRVMAIVGIMQFLDVFIHFFTGFIHPTTGQLVPQPYFSRWIFPGLLLDLALNPYMESTSRLLSSLFMEVVRNDPIRVLRWAVALYQPLSIVLVPVGRRLWYQFTQTINSNCDRDYHNPRQKNLLTQSFSQTLIKLSDTNETKPRRPHFFGSASTGNLLWL